MFDLAIHRGKTSRWATIITLLALLGLVTTPTALAQEGTEVPSTEVVATDVPSTQVATEVPTDVPTQVPTEIPTQVATETPTQIATEVPTEVPATELPATETQVATETATEVPVPTLTSSIATQPTCALAPDQPGAIVSGSSIDYLCTDSVALSGEHIIPASITITWSTSASIAGGWSVQMLQPVNPGEPDPVWTDSGLAEAWFEFRQVNPIGAGIEPVAIDQTATIQYRVRLTRATCAVTPQTLTLDRAIGVGSTDAATIVTANPVVTEPRYLTPELAPIPEPSVAFDGPLVFGEIAVTADGPATSSQPGAVSLTISNLDEGCGAWTLNIAASPLSGSDGTPLNGSQLVAVSVNGSPLTTACDLTAGCAIATLAGGPDALTTQTITLGIELQLPAQPGIGTFDTSLTAALHPAAAD